MARKPRFNIPGVPQHVIQREPQREPCFYTEDDYYRYLQDLHEASEIIRKRGQANCLTNRADIN